MSQMLDQRPEPEHQLAQPAWVVGRTDAGDQGRRSLSLTRAGPRLMQTLQAALPVIGRGVRLALPAVLAVLAAQALDERRRRPDETINCPQAIEPETSANVIVAVWMAQVTVGPGLYSVHSSEKSRMRGSY